MTRIEWFDLLAELAPEPRNKALLELQRTDPLLAEELKDLLALDASAVDFDVGGQLTDAISAAVQAPVVGFGKIAGHIRRILELLSQWVKSATRITPTAGVD